MSTRMHTKIYGYEDHDGDTWYVTESDYLAVEDQRDVRENWFTYAEIEEAYGPLTPLYVEVKDEPDASVKSEPSPVSRTYSVRMINGEELTVSADQAYVGPSGSLEFSSTGGVLGAFASGEWLEFWEEPEKS